MVGVEVENRSGAEVDEAAAVELAQRVLGAEGIEDGSSGWRSPARRRFAR